MQLADDLLTGIEPISEYIDQTPRRTYYLAQRGLIPVFRVGRIIHARKSELDKAFSSEAA